MKHLAIFTLILFSTGQLFSQKNAAKLRYLPIGDSYTICDGAALDQCWTLGLIQQLRKKGIEAELITNPARTGFTTKDVIERQLPLFEMKHPDMATLGIGVNDWVQKVDTGKFRKNLVEIIERMQLALSDPQRLLILTIPDFSVKPEGAKYAKGRDISAGLSEFNTIIFEEAAKRKLKTVDLFSLSQELKYDKQTIADDGVHPSAKEYEIWLRLIVPAFSEILSAQ
jgi:acyl-CoA thioesterase I